MLPVLREHTDAVIEVLQALGFAVGDAEAPDVDPPYLVVWPLEGGKRSGTLANPDEDAVLVYQVTCVGKRREQAQWLADRVRGALLAENLSVPGRFIPRVVPEMFGALNNPGVGVMRDDQGVQSGDEPSPPIFWSAPRFRVISTPA